VCIALHDINKTGVEIGERQNGCHDDSVIKVLRMINGIAIRASS